MVGRASWTTDLSVSGVVDTERILDRRTDATRDLFVTSNSEIPSNTGFQSMITLLRLVGFCPMGRF